MLVLLFLLFACSATLAVPTAEYYELEVSELHFERFIQVHNKVYVDEEEKQFRFQIFKENLEHANRMNIDSEHAVFGITKFMDLTVNEFLDRYTGLMADNDADDTAGDCSVLHDADISYENAPESHDWREHNVVTRVKSQGDCGGCYAFSVIGNIEGQYAIKHKKLIELSEQEIIDCDRLDAGCGGGYMTWAMTALKRLGGVQTEDSYGPYIARAQKCQFEPSKVAVKLIGCNNYDLQSQEKLKQLVYNVGPISVGVHPEGFAFYQKGVRECRHGNITHAVLLVGYGTEDGIPYWLLKNSWGEDTGENGYVKVKRGEDAYSCGMMNHYMASAVIE